MSEQPGDADAGQEHMALDVSKMAVTSDLAGELVLAKPDPGILAGG
jgi:hypothetical protein